MSLTQKDVGNHLDLDQSAVSRFLEKVGLSVERHSLDDIRVAYIRQLRAQAAGHQADDGTNLVKERVLTERIDRELKTLQLAEKRGVLINVAQLEPELALMVAAFKTEMLSRDDKLKSALDAKYGVNVDISLLNEYTFAALVQLARYDAGNHGFDSSNSEPVDASGADINDGMGNSLSSPLIQGLGEAREL